MASYSNRSLFIDATNRITTSIHILARLACHWQKDQVPFDVKLEIDEVIINLQGIIEVVKEFDKQKAANHT